VEFPLSLRYIASDTIIPGETTETNIMAYGFIAEEKGHGDVRMVVPAGAVRTLAERIRAVARPLPTVGDLAFLEWPTTNAACEFRLSFLERGSDLFAQASRLFSQARNAGATVGGGACWLPVEMSPSW
jgi:hypothetical protein